MFESCLRNYKWSKFLYTKGLRPLIVYGRYGDSDGSSDALLGSYNIVVFLTICISYANNCFTL